MKHGLSLTLIVTLLAYGAGKAYMEYNSPKPNNPIFTDVNRDGVKDRISQSKVYDDMLHMIPHIETDTSYGINDRDTTRYLNKHDFQIYTQYISNDAGLF